MVKPIETSEMPVPTEAMAFHGNDHSSNDFEKYFKNLSSGKIGTFDNNVQLTLLPHGGHSSKLQSATERFKLEIQYAKKTLEWHVMFDAQEPSAAPQFLFPETPDFLHDMSVEELEIALPSLANWDCDNEDSLLAVLHELVNLYRTLQVQELMNGTGSYGAFFQAQQLLQAMDIPESDYELYVDSNSCVCVQVRLAVDLSKVPELLLPPLDSGYQEVLASLLLKIQDNRQTSTLILSTRMQLILGQDFKFPSIQSLDKKLELPVFVDNMKKLIDTRIRLVVGGVDSRKNFLTALVTLMGRALVEYDTENFSKASFLLEWNNFYFMVHCCLPKDFPENRPTYLFQSVYHTYKQRPYASKCDDYPYSSKWSPAEMADKAINFMKQYVAKFQTDSVHA